MVFVHQLLRWSIFTLFLLFLQDTLSLNSLDAADLKELSWNCVWVLTESLTIIMLQFTPVSCRSDLRCCLAISWTSTPLLSHLQPLSCLSSRIASCLVSYISQFSLCLLWCCLQGSVFSYHRKNCHQVLCVFLNVEANWKHYFGFFPHLFIYFLRSHFADFFLFLFFSRLSLY